MKFEKLGQITKNLDSRRIPLNSEERIAKSNKGLYPYIGANNIVGYIDEYIFDEKILCVAEDGGSWGANQQCAVIYEGKTWVNNHAHVLIENGKANLEYVKNYLNYANLNKYIKGATRGKLNKSVLENISIPLPSISDQLHIANLLSKAKNLIAQRKESIRLLDEFLKSTFLEMFGDPLKNSKQWRIIKIKDCGKIVTGTTPPSSKDGMFGGGIPFITPSDLESDEPNRRFVTELGAENSRTVRKGATFICCIGATIGKVQRAKVLSAFNQQLNAIEWNNDFNDLFGERLMRFMKPRIIAKGGGSTTLPILNKGDFEKLEIIHPPFELQNQFAQIVEKTEALKSQYQQSLQELENLYGSLSQKAFRGELTIKDEGLLMAAEPINEYKTL